MPFLEKHGVCKYDDRLNMRIGQLFKCRAEIIRFSHLGGNQLDAQPLAGAFEFLAVCDYVAIKPNLIKGCTNCAASSICFPTRSWLRPPGNVTEW
jgi:hypothetical protein